MEGITFEGKPLREVLDQEEVENLHRETVMEHLVSLPLASNKPPQHKSKDGKNGKVRHWTKEDIRKEFGVMSHAFATVVENILWTIKAYPGCNSIKVAEELGISVQDAASRLKIIWDRLEGHGVIGRWWVKGDDNKNRYSYELLAKGTALKTTTLYEKYYKPKPKPEPEFVTDPVMEHKEPSLKLPEFQPKVEKIIERTVKHATGVEVTVIVSGTVEILFGWKK